LFSNWEIKEIKDFKEIKHEGSPNCLSLQQNFDSASTFDSSFEIRFQKNQVD
jgi:hypothetical protein